MIRTETLRALGGYDPEWKHVEDYDLWFRLVYSHRICGVDTFLLKWRVWPGSISEQFRAFQRQRSRVLRRFAVEKEGARYRSAQILAYSAKAALHFLIRNPLTDHKIGMANLRFESGKLLLEKHDVDQAYEKFVDALRNDQFHWGSIKARVKLFMQKHRGRLWKTLIDKSRGVANLSFPAILLKDNHPRPRILLFSVMLPYPVKSGGNVRTLSLLKYLSKCWS